MFEITKFINKVKEKYTCDLTMSWSKRISHIIYKPQNIDLYTLDKLIKPDWEYITIPAWAYTFDTVYLNAFEKLLKNNIKNFSWFKCWYTGFELILICPSCKEEEIYNKLLRLEKLKAFL